MLNPEQKINLSKLLPLVAFCFFLLSITFNFIDVFKGFWDHDSGFYFNQSDLMARGYLPYRDFATIYPPLYNAINAIPIALGVDRWLLIWLIPLTWILISSFLSVRFAQIIFPQLSVAAKFFVAATFPLYCIDFAGNHNTLELGVVAFALWALVQFQKSEKVNFFIVGLLICMTILCKQVGVLFLLPFASQCRTSREALSLLAGIVTGLLLALAALQFDIESIRRSYELFQFYVSGSAQKNLDAIFLDFFRMIWIDVFRTPLGVALFVFCLLLSSIAAFQQYQLRAWRTVLWILSWQVVCIGLLATRAINNFPHYTLNCWPALLVLATSSIKICNRGLALRLAAYCLGLASLFLIVFYSKINAMPYGPYFSRWSHSSELAEFIHPVAVELRNRIPVDATVHIIGPESFALLFLANKIQVEKDWTADMTQTTINSDFIIFIDFDSPFVQAKKAEILAHDYTITAAFQSAQRRVILFQRAQSTKK